MVIEVIHSTRTWQRRIHPMFSNTCSFVRLIRSSRSLHCPVSFIREKLIETDQQKDKDIIELKRLQLSSSLPPFSPQTLPQLIRCKSRVRLSPSSFHAFHVRHCKMYLATVSSNSNYITLYLKFQLRSLCHVP
jgi:hypothetical protein